MAAQGSPPAPWSRWSSDDASAATPPCTTGPHPRARCPEPHAGARPELFAAAMANAERVARYAHERKRMAAHIRHAT